MRILLKMTDKIDVSEIMKALDEKIKKGLAEKRLTVTDISLLIGEHLEKAKEKILEDTGNIVGKESKSSDECNCKDCGNPLKKTKK